MAIGYSNFVTINDIKYKKCTNSLHEGSNILTLEQMTYNSNKGKSIRYRVNCLDCDRKYSQLKRQSKEYNTQHAMWHKKRRSEKGLAWSIWMSAKRNAKSRGLDFTLQENDIVIPDFCPILNIPLIKDVNYLKYHNKLNQLTTPNYPSMDRIDVNKGYIKENIHVISWRANHLKHDATLQEFEMVYNWWKKQLNK